jgi:glycosyltransferase involved in cell wall biosynthesis
MATAPYFVISPNTLMSILGLIRGPDKTVPTPAEDWRNAVVDVVIPALNEEKNIPLCLASLMRQTLRPRKIILVDDGSTDKTPAYAKDFCDANGVELIMIRRKAPIGKTPTIKRQAREFDSDVEFILDGDTVLESDNYIERTVQELYKGVGIASACGTILPLRDRDRKVMLGDPAVKNFLSVQPGADLEHRSDWFPRFQRGLSNLYRDALYLFLQRFIYHGQMVFFGTITNPVGCAVAYRRRYVEALFEKFEPLFGDDLTNSEDIFIGFSMLERGYRNIQLTDVYARSEEPEAKKLPRQIYMWSSSFLQSCYYFDSLLRSPFKALKRYRHRRMEKRKFREQQVEKRRIREQYRQTFGEEHTRMYGRPMGWVLLMAAIEKVFFPTALVIMIILRLWEPLGITVAAETLLSLIILTFIAKGHRAEYFLKGLLLTPIRYSSLLYDLVTIGRFSADLWIFRNRRWRK